ncbi:MAG: PD40 domain-containing protein [Caldilineaceae bacterium]|nr:PD40 domain-containing protein [Caldilineaceae bacterium]MBP8108695.1 PD40 domain-containing protein [Caldilineaceae bacterium]MBP8121050.1 PD40 domain-containing protein [Caldilineaceae bacterium]MBP9073796.1 PD40 domain-containing protein [Caldilineaceae bacterium]
MRPKTTRSFSRPAILTALSLVWIALLFAACQPVAPGIGLSSVPDEQANQGIGRGTDRGSGQQSAPDRLTPIGSLPIPQVEWDQPPACESLDQSQATICARLLFRADDELREVVWSSQGIDPTTRSLANVPDGITSFSPDFSHLVVQTPRGDTAGGPLYLYDLATEELINLNEQVGLPTYTSVSALRVVGWHQDGQQLLLVNEGDEVTIWLDLASGSYRPLDLGIDTSQMAPPRLFMLAQDGQGFTFVSYSRESTSRESASRESTGADSATPGSGTPGSNASGSDKSSPGTPGESPRDDGNRNLQASNLYWYDLIADETRLVLAAPAVQGRLAATAIAPDSSRLAYVRQLGGRMMGRSQELYLLDLNETDPDADSSRLLYAGNLGPTAPVWSPDGEQIALIQRDLAEPMRADPNQPPPLGDIWILSTQSGEATQLTFTQAIEQPPVWSPDGRYLAFVTAGGQIGMVGVDTPGKTWLMDETTVEPQLIQIAFLPQEQSE